MLINVAHTWSLTCKQLFDLPVLSLLQAEEAHDFSLEQLAAWLRDNGIRIFATENPETARRAASTGLDIKVLLVANGDSANPENNITIRHASDGNERDLWLIRVIEEWHCSSISRTLPSISRPRNGSVLVVGTGIVSLMTAFNLQRRGYAVRIVTAEPDPAISCRTLEAGCTFSGNDARIFSINESRHHHFGGSRTSEICGSPYSRTIQDDGWLCWPSSELTAEDRKWVNHYMAVPSWMQHIANEEMLEFNRESLAAFQDMVRSDPDLFQDVGHIPELVRIYEQQECYEKALREEARIGALIEPLADAELEDVHPGFPLLKRDGVLAGALRVKGFGINIHKFGKRVIHALRTSGVEFSFATPVSDVLVENGRVTCVVTPDGELSADNYVFSLGVGTDSLAARFGCKGLVAGMIGAWLTLPDPEALLRKPLKISRSGFGAKGYAAGANVIPGYDRDRGHVIHVSSGHGFLGLSRRMPEPEQQQIMSRAVHETARTLFPDTYRQRFEEGQELSTAAYCIRPWTPSCLGLFSTLPTTSGGAAILTGGHNTGGFAHSPAVANAVLRYLEGEHHPMHSRYDPRRLELFGWHDR